MEKTALQIAVVFACLVPIGAGAAGIVLGPAMLGVPAAIELDSHFRYLSGLLLGVGVAFATCIPGIERHRERFRGLTAIVVIGGLGRLVALLAVGTPSYAMLAALVMELGVTPALAAWQGRVARARDGCCARGEFASPERRR